MTSDFVKIQATEAHEKIFQDLVELLEEHCAEHPATTTTDILAILGRTAGYCVGLHLPERRESARDVVTMNLDVAARDMAGEDA